MATFTDPSLYYRLPSFTQDGKGIRAVEVFHELAGFVFAMGFCCALWKAYNGNAVVWKVCLAFIDFIFVELIYLLSQDYFKPGYDVIKCVFLGLGLGFFLWKLYYIGEIKKWLIRFGLVVILNKKAH